MVFDTSDSLLPFTTLLVPFSETIQSPFLAALLSESCEARPRMICNFSHRDRPGACVAVIYLGSEIRQDHDRLQWWCDGHGWFGVYVGKGVVVICQMVFDGGRSNSSSLKG